MVFEVRSDAIAQRVIPEAKAISRYPSNRRDIAVVVPEDVAAAEVLAECKKLA